MATTSKGLRDAIVAHFAEPEFGHFSLMGTVQVDVRPHAFLCYLKGKRRRRRAARYAKRFAKTVTREAEVARVPAKFENGCVTFVTMALPTGPVDISPAVRWSWS